MNNEFKKEIIDFANYKKEHKGATIFNFLVYTFSLGIALYGGFNYPVFANHMREFMTTVGIVFGSGYFISGYGLYNDMKRVKNHFKDKYGIDIFKYDLSDENIESLAKELEMEERKSKVESISLSNDDTKKKVHGNIKNSPKYEFKGYEEHDELASGKKLTLSKDK